MWEMLTREKVGPRGIGYHGQMQCCGSESESDRIRAVLAETESKLFVPDSDPDPVIQ